MARKLRVQFQGAIYHVTIRGVDRRRIFDGDADRERFIQRLDEAAAEHEIRVYLFACMRNHVHLVCETPRANLSVFMHKVQTAYTVYYNLRNQRAGHLMQGRFGAEHVSGDAYLLKLSRYIHLNPVFVHGIKNLPLEERLRHLRSYPWSSYRGYAGLAEPYGCVDEAPLLGLMGMPAATQRRAYRRFVETGLTETDAEFRALLKTSRWGVGDDGFQARIRGMHKERALTSRRLEDVSFRRVAPMATANAVLDAVAQEYRMESATLQRRQYACEARAVAALLLGRCAGMNQRDIGIFLGMGSGVAVCLQLQRLRERQANDAGLTERIKRVAADITSAIIHPP